MFGIKIVILESFLSSTDIDFIYTFYCTGKELKFEEVKNLSLAPKRKFATNYYPKWYEVYLGDKIYLHKEYLDRDHSAEFYEFTINDLNIELPADYNDKYRLQCDQQETFFIAELDCKKLSRDKFELAIKEIESQQSR